MQVLLADLLNSISCSVYLPFLQCLYMQVKSLTHILDYEWTSIRCVQTVQTGYVLLGENIMN